MSHFVHPLIDGLPIVTHDFFAAVLSRAEAVTALPHVQAFLPEVSNGTTQSVVQEDFQVNPARKTMLCGHLFFFFTAFLASSSPLIVAS